MVGQPEPAPEYCEFKGRYAGDVDPMKKIRQGQGAYTYSNPFF
jgi:hypothetical protein